MQEVFRIAAKAVVLDVKSHMKIMKRCEMEGKPYEILDERTVVIKFKSKDIDAVEFEGSPIRTWRGIWGKVIKSIEPQVDIHLYDSRIRKRTEFLWSSVHSQMHAGSFLCFPQLSGVFGWRKKERGLLGLMDI
ncbi:hypothetical protein C5167_043966 [Papaver somniferum]|uniref:Ribosome biogenesis protein BMS1/TSR1 C-terminal domain-containing protein n=1 Tax=Papaver somniferum TaxID=3469 RepID=A0A4Y7LAR8_PAPSO|nr:hypothetical protein C5167_043966 [Papaver somniferum]